MFALYDRNSSGSIDFREYLIGLSLVAAPAVTDSTVELAFRIFDEDGDGFISLPEFSKLLKNSHGGATDAAAIFEQVATKLPDRISYDEFHQFARQRPEYAYLFVCHRNAYEAQVQSHEE